MRTLIVEDDFTSRRLLQLMLAPYGESDLVENGAQAVAAFTGALASKTPYDLVCLDIMMPEIDGQDALKALRQAEQAGGIAPQDEAKIIMVSALDSPNAVIEAYYRGRCTSYLVKPVDKNKLLALLRDFGLIA